MMLFESGAEIAARRRAMGLSQRELATQSWIGRSTLDALENGRMGELGCSKVNRVLTILGLELRLHEISRRRPTLEELLEENRPHQCLDRRK